MNITCKIQSFSSTFLPSTLQALMLLRGLPDLSCALEAVGVERHRHPLMTISGGGSLSTLGLNASSWRLCPGDVAGQRVLKD